MTTYESIRPQLKTGHVVLWQGNGLISRLIRLRSRFSHASLVVRLEMDGLGERLWLVEALAEGVVLRILSKRLASYDGKAFILQPAASDGERRAILDFAMTTCGCGVRYDYRSLLRNILGRVSTDASRYFCSELVFDAYRHAQPWRGATTTAPTPGDLPQFLGGGLVEVCA